MAKRRDRRVLFTKEQDAFLRLHYKELGAPVCAARLGRHPASVRSRAQKLGCANIRQTRKSVANYVRAVLPCQTGNPAVAGVLEFAAKPLASPALALPVSPALARLAQFDPLFARVVSDKRAGKAAPL